VHAFPKGQEKAPRSAANASGGQIEPGGSGAKQNRTQGDFPAWVKVDAQGGSGAFVRWPAWITPVYLNGRLTLRGRVRP
jgi:hypothetical protein